MNQQFASFTVTLNHDPVSPGSRVTTVEYAPPEGRLYISIGAIDICIRQDPDKGEISVSAFNTETLQSVDRFSFLHDFSKPGDTHEPAE